MSTHSMAAKSLGGLLLAVGLLLHTAAFAHPHPAQRSARSPDLRFQHLTVYDGLAHNSVYAIIQDRHGFMWFGTYVGLTRYDGYTMTVYKHDPDDPGSLSHNAVTALHEDADGNLWIGTSQGLNRYDRRYDRFIRYMHDPDDTHSLNDHNIDWERGMYTDPQGSLWVSTRSSLEMFDAEGDRFVHSADNPNIPAELRDQTIRLYYEDGHGMRWIVSKDAGVFRVDPETGELIEVSHAADDAAALSSASVIQFFEDARGTLWLVASNGVNRFVRETGQFVRYLHDPDDPASLSGLNVMRMTEDFAGRLWVATTKSGLNLFQPETGGFLHYYNDRINPQSLNDDLIRSLYYADSGVLWIGTKAGGVNALMRGSEQFTHYQAEPDTPGTLSHNTVFPICEDRDGMIWIGTREEGLNRFDRATGEFTVFRHEPDDPTSLSYNRIHALYEDRAGALWVGTYNYNLERFDRGTGVFTHYPPGIDLRSELPDEQKEWFHAFYEDDQARFWVATAHGLWLLDRGTGEKQVFQHDPDNPDSLSHSQVLVLYEDTAGRFWVGTDGGGLNLFNRDTGRAAHWTYEAGNAKSFSNTSVTCLHEDRAGRFWVGTRRGLNLFDRDTGIVTRRYHERDGLPNDRIYGILEDDDGNLWISTNMGLARFDPDAGVFTTYDERDGVQGNEFNTNSYCRTRDGLMLFGGFNGITAFYPQNVTSNPYIPPVVLTDFQLAHQRVPITEDGVLTQSLAATRELTLSYQDSIISFEFAALNFITPQHNRYRYILDGFDEDWREVGANRRFVTYTNLPPGTYTFWVKGANNDGLWNEEGRFLLLTITPPWWQRWWFRGMALLLALVILFSGYWARVYALQRRKQELEAEVETRTYELHQEIETRKQTEHALRESEERFRSIVETTPSMLCITDTDKRLVYVSPNCQDFIGYAQHELVGSFRIWAHDDDQARLEETMNRAFREQQRGRNFEYKAIRKDGSVWYASSAWEPLHDEHGAFLGFVLQTLDITERKKAEEELERLYRQTRADAEVKAELLREVNHRVGNNLTAIAGMLSLERRHLKARDQATYQNLMQDLTNRVNGLARVHELLSASEWSPVLLHDLAERVVHSSLQIVPLDTQVRVQIEPSDLRVNADQAHHLALILNELATNSAKYAIRQRATAELRLAIDQDDGLAEIRIQDDGPGYSEDALRGERRNVGLHLVEQLIRRNLHGDWRIANDGGAVTWLRFPCQNEEGEES